MNTRTSKTLPIDALLPEIEASLRAHPNLVLGAATGAGKTTRVPPALLASGLAGDGRILMLEPRRIAARAAARRMAEERGSRLGDEVGYQIRFDRKFGPKTRILVVTEGILVSFLQRDPFLEGVAIVIFDEVHERSIHTDLSLALARRVQREVREDLRLVAMSATLESQRLARFLGDCPVVESPGRSFPVTIHHQDVSHRATGGEPSIPTRVAAGVRQALDATSGDLLIFLPGVGEIHRTAEVLEPLARRQSLALHRLYGDLDPGQQDAVLRPGARRKVILATNVAETSLTIEGITGVVDSGLAKSLRFDPARGLDRLEMVRISRASAEQRAGRAGRLGPGYCLRLWSEHEHRSRPEREMPEILRVDLAATVLELLVWGEGNLAAFDWLEAPEPEALIKARNLLSDLGAVASSGVTELGRRMARLPLQPRLARLVLAGRELGVAWSAAQAAALLSERDVVERPPGPPATARYSTGSDLLDRLRALDALTRSGFGETAAGPIHRGRTRHVERLAKDIARAGLGRADRGRKMENELPLGDAGHDESLGRALLAAYPDRLARRREPGSDRALMTGGRGLRLARSSSVREAELFLALDIDGGRSGERSESFARLASAIEASWLRSGWTREETIAQFDPARQRAVGLRRHLYRDLVLTETEVDPGAEEASRALVQAALVNLERALPLDQKEVAAFLSRCRWLAEARPDLAFETFGQERFAELLPALAAGRRSFAELRRAPLLDILRGALGFEQLAKLDRLAPESHPVPSGSQIRLAYEPGKPPVLAVRIQELFGLREHPCLAGGRIPVLLHLLAPNMRPQQVTQDLASFWRNTYPEIKKELQGRYPKHSWPNDPLAAPAQKRPRRRRPS